MNTFLSVTLLFMSFLLSNPNLDSNYSHFTVCDFGCQYIMMIFSAIYWASLLILLALSPSFPPGQSRFILGFSHVVNQTRPRWNCIDWEECM